jgi:hypothetical protein
MAKLSVKQLVNKLLAVLSSREREVLERRNGLKDSNILTLAEIGNLYGITRERVRQIEEAALNKLSGEAKKGELNEFFSVVENHLKAVGGLRREDLLLEDLRFLLRDSTDSAFWGNQVKFLLGLSSTIGYSAEDNDFHPYWYSSKDIRQKAVSFVVKLAKNLEARKEAFISVPANVNVVVKEAAAANDLKESVGLNYISLSKLFHINQYGDFGLASWSEINPKTVRHWAHLVLRKLGKPLHFTEIAQAINKVRQGAAKAVNTQTVHNELIKDTRFVLVGRGLYGLKEFGLMPGTAREVIARLLKTHGPQKPKSLLNLVKKERLFKDNTIFINLQNKKYFQRLSDGRYTVKEV